MVGRSAIAALLLGLPVSASAATRESASDHDPAYALANTRLARIVPSYPRARLLIAEPVSGGIAVGRGIGDRPFQTIQRIYALARPTTQRAVTRFYAERLGTQWQRRREACFVSQSRLVVALVSLNRRRLGVVIDSRGGRYCYDHTGIISDLLQVGYPD